MGQKLRHPRLKGLQASMDGLKPAPSQSRTPASSRKSGRRKAQFKDIEPFGSFSQSKTV
jgi:hypothetical protein